MKRRIHILVLILSISFCGYSQNVGINTTGATPNASALLDLNTGSTFTGSNGKGLLIPNVDFIKRDITGKEISDNKNNSESKIIKENEDSRFSYGKAEPPHRPCIDYYKQLWILGY